LAASVGGAGDFRHARPQDLMAPRNDVQSGKTPQGGIVLRCIE